MNFSVPGFHKLLADFNGCGAKQKTERPIRHFHGVDDDFRSLAQIAPALDAGIFGIPKPDLALARRLPVFFDIIGIDVYGTVKKSVLKGPGSTTITLMPKGATSLRNPSESPSTAHLLAP